jgi:clan AA aspartic protease (TIGR02281 family)
VLSFALVGACTPFGSRYSSAASTTSPSLTQSSAPVPATKTDSTDWEPQVSRLGSDVSELPSLYPQGDWVPLVGPLLSMDLQVSVVMNGVATTATLDTGAQSTTMSNAVAERLGLRSPEQPFGATMTAVDAHGSIIRGEKLIIDTLALGKRVFRKVPVSVLGEDPDMFLIGADILQDFDLFVAADEGLVALFEAGSAPRHPSEQTVGANRGDRQLSLFGFAEGDRPARFSLLVDTGAWNTSVPSGIGVGAGLPADLGYTTTTVGVAGEQESRGRFVLAPLRLGGEGVTVGRVYALASLLARGDGYGLLGNDVFFRFHTVVSFRDAAVRFRPLPVRPAVRFRGPAGVRCGVDGQAPCVQVSLAALATPPAADDLPGLCLQVDVDAAFAGKTVELAITAEDPHEGPLFNGGGIRAFLTVDDAGAHHCFTLWRSLGRLGVDLDTVLSLRWVRTEGFRWPCDPLKSRCITFSGPLQR